jgi:hypothetical protein
MIRFRRPGQLTLWLLLLPLAWELGCSRPVGLSAPEDATTPDQHQVPFHEDSGDAHAAPDGQRQDRGLKPEIDLPFRDAQSLPAGTLLTVRLKTSVCADNAKGRDTFEAIVDEPVTIEGNTLVPRGASVAGRVESGSGAAGNAATKGNGYVRLTLESIDLAGTGNEQGLQTSSLFARGRPPATHNGSPGLITLEKGRRLTFRLTEPAYVALGQSPAGH